MGGQGIVVGGESFDGKVLVQSFAVCIMPSVHLLEIVVDFVEAMLQRILEFRKSKRGRVWISNYGLSRFLKLLNDLVYIFDALFQIPILLQLRQLQQKGVHG